MASKTSSECSAVFRYSCLTNRGETVSIDRQYTLSHKDYAEEHLNIDKSDWMYENDVAVILDWDVISVVKKINLNSIYVLGAVLQNGEIRSEIIKNYTLSTLYYHDKMFGHNDCTRNFRWNSQRGLFFTVGRSGLSTEEYLGIHSHLSKRLGLPLDENGWMIFNRIDYPDYDPEGFE